MSEYVPKLVCFSCNFGWGYLTGQEQLAAIVKNWVPVICSGKIDTTTLLQAFAEGADGILILGCCHGDCHFQDGNYQTDKRIRLLRKVLAAHGIEPERVETVFSLDPEGKTIPGLIKDLGLKLQAFGPARI